MEETHLLPRFTAERTGIPQDPHMLIAAECSPRSTDQFTGLPMDKGGSVAKRAPVGPRLSPSATPTGTTHRTRPPLLPHLPLPPETGGQELHKSSPAPPTPPPLFKEDHFVQVMHPLPPQVFATVVLKQAAATHPLSAQPTKPVGLTPQKKASQLLAMAQSCSSALSNGTCHPCLVLSNLSASERGLSLGARVQVPGATS